MRKESVQKFDLKAAFKALNEVEIPVVKGIRPNREDLQAKFTRKLVTDVLVEDYYDIGDSEELGQAQEEREAEIAKAKLARIEKIVDLEAETEEDLLPSYVGKLIIQCPQCMTLFYKNEEDVEKSEENPEVVNLNEPCQHCGNSSGYTLIGKVDTVGEEEASQYDAEDFDENELDLNFDEEEAPAEEESAPAETEESEEVATEEGNDIDLDLAPIEEEEEEVKESLSLKEGWDTDVANADKLLDEIIKQSGNEAYDDGDGYWSGDDEWCNRYMYYANSVNNIDLVNELCEKYSTDSCQFYVVEDDAEEDPVSEIGYTLTKTLEEALDKNQAVEEVPSDHKTADKGPSDKKGANKYADAFDVGEIDPNSGRNRTVENIEDVEVSEEETLESLNEGIDKELDDKLKAHNDYIEYLKKMIEEEEASLAKATNEYVKKAIQRRLEAFKADLEEALPDALKDEAISADELPTPEEVDMEAAAENKEEPKEKKESLTEAVAADSEVEAEAELTEDATITEADVATMSKLKRKLSATELMIPELKAHPMFKKLSTRTIQRVLLPYYIENMGREDLSAQALIDFFEFEGFAPYVLDHFMTMDPLARKELLKADAKFMKIFNDYATAYNFFPGKDETLDPGESEFDYAFNIIFDIGADGSAQDTEPARDMIKALGKMYAAGEYDPSLIVEKLTEDAAVDVLFDSEEFKTPISDAEIDKIRAQYEGLEEDIAPGVETAIAINNIVDTWESVEDFDDETFNKLTENYLTDVYSNVKSFETTNCDLKDSKLIVEGTITFNSGKTKSTAFIYETKEIADKTIVLEGLNADFASEKAFTLNCTVDAENRLIVESLNYKYTINDTLVEGLLK